MDKNAIKKYAIWARRELLSRVGQKALQYGISEEDCGDREATSVNGHLLTDTEMEQRKALIDNIQRKGYREVMESVAYTWFNRFSALRFMEVNGYLPSHVRVFTDDDNAFKPQILTEAIHLEMDGLDMEAVYAMKEENRTEDLFKYLIITQCNALSPILPGMFQRISDYTELLFPDNLLREGSVIHRMITDIGEDDWRDQIQIIGWLYQYYNSEKKDEVFAALKKNVKITKENIPAATQLFTPDWIVRYMVENSLGRLWVEGHPNEELKSNWKYYLEEAEQEPEVQAQLDEIRRGYADMTPEDIKCIDPCCGSGHILAYLFDVLIQIYESHGYTARDAVRHILEKNLYGLDIDDRAAQLAYFSVMMKARQYDRRIFSRGVQPHVYAIEESNYITQATRAYFCKGDPALAQAMDTICTELHDAKEYGSILTVTEQDWNALYDRFDEIFDDVSAMERSFALEMLPMVRVAEVLAQRYDVVVTNPPYMGASGMSGKLAEYVKKNFPDSKSDLFAVFIEQCGKMAKRNGYQTMITQHAWMFLSSFEQLREKLLQKEMVNMAHLGARAFEEIGGEVVQTTSFVINNRRIKGYKGTYCRLVEPTTQQGKNDLFLAAENRYITKQDDFNKIPGSPLAYWANDTVISAFTSYKTIGNVARPRLGFATGDNDQFMRLWFEPSITNIGFYFADRDTAKVSGLRWFPTNKGGTYRKWYGNLELVVNWKNDGEEIRNFKDENGKLRSRPQNLSECFSEGVSWTVICNHSSFRYSPKGMLYNNKGPILGHNNCAENFLYLGYLNSSATEYFLQILSPTLGFESGYVSAVPYNIPSEITGKIKNIVSECIQLSKLDWDAFETTWDFKRCPLV